MIVTNESVLKMSVSDIKYHNNGYFFSRNTMKFFGDKMTSFGVRIFEGKRIMYRKPTAYVNVFGTRKIAGKYFFGCWHVNPISKEEVEINPVDNDFKDRFYNYINNTGR